MRRLLLLKPLKILSVGFTRTAVREQHFIEGQIIVPHSFMRAFETNVRCNARTMLSGGGAFFLRFTNPQIHPQHNFILLQFIKNIQSWIFMLSLELIYNKLSKKLGDVVLCRSTSHLILKYLVR